MDQGTSLLYDIRTPHFVHLVPWLEEKKRHSARHDSDRMSQTYATCWHILRVMSLGRLRNEGVYTSSA